MNFEYYHFENYGIHLYNKQIKYYIAEDEIENQSIKTYRFFLKLIEKPDGVHKTSEMFEEIEFIATLNLKDYCYTRTISKNHPLYHLEKGSPQEYHIDFDKIVHEFFDKEKLENLKLRLKRRIENKHREPIYFKDVYGDTVEFLEFDESACNWGGHHHGGLMGCAISFGKQDIGEEDISTIDDLDFTNSFKLWMLPESYDIKFRCCNSELSEKLENSHDERKSFLSNLSKRDLLCTFNRYKQEAVDEESLLSYYDYIICLYGTDDTSYTKGFHTEEEMMEEVQRLRNTQPLNMSLDIMNKGYIFTN